MASDHKRNVRGMHAAPRCEARTEKGRLCSAPAVQGKYRCHNHGGKGSKAQSYPYKFGDYTKANLERDRQIEDAIRDIDKTIRSARLGGYAFDLIGPLEKIRRKLRDTTQQGEAALAGSYAPSAADKEETRKANLHLSHAAKYDVVGKASRDRLKDRALGAIIGLAVGEAVGITMEDQPRDTCERHEDMVGGGIFELERGQWAGDTAMALALLNSLEYRKKFDATDSIDRLADWATEGAYSSTGECIGLGEVTSEALTEYRRFGNPFAGDENPDCLDSGSLVRIAPVAMRYWGDRRQLREVAAQQSQTTHGSYYAVEACVAFAEILADAILGRSRTDIFQPRRMEGASSIDSIVTGSWKRLQREDIRSTNNVINLLDASLWCVNVSDTFAEAVLRAANLGHDAGTIAALTGQLAGAICGASSIPAGWTEDLSQYYQILDWAEPLIKAGFAR